MEDVTAAPRQPLARTPVEILGAPDLSLIDVESLAPFDRMLFGDGGRVGALPGMMAPLELPPEALDHTYPNGFPQLPKLQQNFVDDEDWLALRAKRWSREDEESRVALMRHVRGGDSEEEVSEEEYDRDLGIKDPFSKDAQAHEDSAAEKVAQVVAEESEFMAGVSTANRERKEQKRFGEWLVAAMASGDTVNSVPGANEPGYVRREPFFANDFDVLRAQAAGGTEDDGEEDPEVAAVAAAQKVANLASALGQIVSSPFLYTPEERELARTALAQHRARISSSSGKTRRRKRADAGASGEDGSGGDGQGSSGDGGMHD